MWVPFGALREQIVSWNDGDTNASFGRNDPNKGWSSDGASSLPSLCGTLSTAALQAAPSPFAATAAATASASAAASPPPSWSSRRPHGAPNSLRRDLTLVVVTRRAEAKSWAEALDPVRPLFVHLRFASTKGRLYVATCLAALANLPVSSRDAPAERGKAALEVTRRGFALQLPRAEAWDGSCLPSALNLLCAAVGAAAARQAGRPPQALDRAAGVRDAREGELEPVRGDPAVHEGRLRRRGATRQGNYYVVSVSPS